MNASDSQAVISPYETDSVYTNEVVNHAAWKLGVSAPILSSFFEQNPLLHHLLVEFNLYHQSAKLKGSVWQYQFPEFNNYAFKAQLDSTRFMIDLKPELVTWYRVSPYPIVGIGVNLNRLSYYETATEADVDPSSRLALSSRTTTQFAFDLGAGLRVPFNEQWSGTVEYIYTDLGHASPRNASLTGANLLTAPSFSLKNQSVLLGITFAC